MSASSHFPSNTCCPSLTSFSLLASSEERLSPDMSYASSLKPVPRSLCLLALLRSLLESKIKQNESMVERVAQMAMAGITDWVSAQPGSF